jgi:hypothetical protein
MCTGEITQTANQQGYSGPASVFMGLLGRLPPGMNADGTMGTPASGASAPAAAPSKAAVPANTGAGKTGGNSVGGAGSAVASGSGLLTPAFAAGSTGFKQLLGQ